MTRAEFIATLRRKLRGIPPGQRDGIVADYDSYFDEGIAAGRSERQVAAALGSPTRLAAELAIDLNIAAWRDAPSRRTALKTITGVMGLLVFDGLLLVPFVFAVCVLAAVFFASIFSMIYGGFALVVLPFDAPPGGPLAAILRAIGFLSAGSAGLALCALSTHPLAAAVTRIARVHRRTLRLPSNQTSNPGAPHHAEH